MSVRLFIAALGVLLTVLSAKGHQSPVHVVDALSADMAGKGVTPKRLIARAYEYQALGDWSAAAADFSAAVELDPHSRTALIGCAEALLQLGVLTRAESMSRQGLAVSIDPAEKAPFFAVLAQSFAARELWTEALDAWRAALLSPSPRIDWFLGEAEALLRLGSLRERVDSLVEAKNRNPSVVLQRAWIHALVDAGLHEPALVEIEHEISQARWKSSWLLLRARIHQAGGREAAKTVDARAALLEINSRFNADRPDPHLLKEASEAVALLDEDPGIIEIYPDRPISGN